MSRECEEKLSALRLLHIVSPEITVHHDIIAEQRLGVEGGGEQPRGCESLSAG